TTRTSPAPVSFGTRPSATRSTTTALSARCVIFTAGASVADTHARDSATDLLLAHAAHRHHHRPAGRVERVHDLRLVRPPQAPVLGPVDGHPRLVGDRLLRVPAPGSGEPLR